MSGGGDDVGVEALMEYEFGVPLREQLTPAQVTLQENVWQRRFERVRRQYEQRVQYKDRPDTELQIVAITGGVRLTFPATDVNRVRIGWALTATPGTEIDFVDLPISDLTNVSGDLYRYDIAIASFDPGTSYRFTVRLTTSSGRTTTLTGDGPGTGTSRLFVNEPASGSAISVSWVRPAEALSARLAWGPDSVPTSFVDSASGPAPLTEANALTLDMTDTRICPSDAAVCSYRIVNLVAGTEYTVALATYRQPDARGEPISIDRMTLMTSGTRPPSVVSVSAAPLTISEGGTGSTITLSTRPAPDRSAGFPVTYTVTHGAGLSASEYALTDSNGNVVGSSVIIPAGALSVALTLTALTDTDTVETSETLTFRLADPAPDTGYVLDANQREVAVTINPVPLVSFTTDAISVSENAGTATVDGATERFAGHTDNHSGAYNKRHGNSRHGITRH